MKKKILILVIIIFVVIAFLGVFWFINGLKPVNINNQEEQIVEIDQGIGTEGILNTLKQHNLINNTFIAKIYVKLNRVSGLQAGTYQLNQAMSLEEILNKISSGEVYDESVKITFLEGKNMRWIASKIAEKTNNKEDDVYNLLEDKSYIQSLIEKYWFLTNEVTSEEIYYPLEGYLFPDTYIFENKDVSVKTIFNIILNNIDKILTKYRTEIQESSFNIHQILTIASIVELEGNTEEERQGIASVIYNRLKSNMSLGSDVTTYYAIKTDMGERNLYAPEINTYNPYNTRGPSMAGKLPIGPICNPSEEAIKATLNPLETNYLYFVADSTGKIYFTSTYKEHQEVIQRLQKQGLWYEYESTDDNSYIAN